MSRTHRWWAVTAVLVLAAVLRLWELEARPPHHDEGVNGWFAEKLLRDGAYVYDPVNYHGPSYFYLLAGSREAFGFGLWQLRLPGALAGIALCFVPLCARRRLGWPTALAACAVLAVSPTLVYYARYAIHETLLAGLGLVVAACVLRWSEHGRGAWIIAAAAALAAMIATKETTILFLAISGVWLAGEIAVESIRARRLTVLGRTATWSRHATIIAVAALAVMAAIHVVLFTGCFRAPGSLGTHLHRSVQAYAVWRETGTGPTGHAKDVCYYLHLGARYELVLYALAAIGLVHGLRERWIRGPALVGFGMLAAYSAIAYKMPWLPTSWLALLAWPAASGAVVVGRVLARELSPRLGLGAAVVLITIPALLITVRSSFLRGADRREALAYVHTHADHGELLALIEAGAARTGADRLVVAVDHDTTWPLAWSLTPYPRTRWSARGGEDVLIVAVGRAAAVEARLEGPYLRRQYQLRDSAEPAYVYFRRSLYKTALAAAQRRGEVTVIGPGADAPRTASVR